MEGLLTLFGRLRRSRGFGVHSPFAYTFITEVLRQPYAYYCYGRLAGRCERTVFRVALHLHPQCVALLDGAEHLSAAVSSAWADTRFADAACADMVIGRPSQALVDAAARGASVIMLGSDAAALSALRSALPWGMTFSSTRGMTVAAALRYLPRQDFDIIF